MTKRLWPLCAMLLIAAPLTALDLRQATFTQVIKDVTVVSSGTKSTAKAKLNDMFINPDIVQTGPDSLAELVAEDKTVTRIGANTIFSFSAKGREVNLEQGSVLFHSPKGKGGGTIKTKAASASVLGTTIVVTATMGGGFKAIVLEGKGQITLPNGDFRVLQAGQVTFVLPGSRQFGPQLNINLSKLVENSRLIQGFEKELPSKPIIQIEVERQTTLIRTGQAEDTKILVANSATKDTVTTVDSTVLEQVVENRVDKLAVAKGNDVRISSPDLRTYPEQVFTDRSLVDVPVLGALNFSGLVGKIITITAAQIDFTPFLNQSDFKIVADDYLNIQKPPLVPMTLGPVDLDLNATPVAGVPQSLQSVAFVGRNGLTIESGYVIKAANLGEVSFVSGAVMSLNNVSFVNLDGKLELNGHSVLDLTGGFISAPSLLVNGGTVNLLNGSYYANTGSAVLSAYGTDLLANNVTVNGDTVSFQANATADLHSVTASATTLLNLDAEQDLRLAGGSYTVSGSGGTAQLSADRDIFISSGAQFQANTVQMTATRDATLTGPVIRGFTTLNVNAVQNLAVASGSFTGASSSPTVAANLSAGDTLTVNGTSIANVANISLSARTVNLSNIDFPGGSTVNLYSQLGQLAANPNTGAASVPGHVNFILNVNYSGNPAQLYVGSTINIAARP